jgi:hypothetical protein
MAQSAAFQNDSSLYYHSSPLYSITNAGWRLISTCVLSQILKEEDLPLSTVMKIATRLQTDNWNSRSEKPVPGRRNEILATGTTSTWPRWLFFVMGPLPAAIKLCSFQGTPGTQALGLMSLSGFLVNEAMYILTGPPRSIPQVAVLLNLSDDSGEEVEGRKQLRDKFKKASDLLNLLEVFIWVISAALHLFLLIWAEMKVWNVLCDFLAKKENDLGESWRNAFQWIDVGITFSCK